MLADGESINGVTLFNNRGDKTHLIGDGSHFGWMPNINVLLCPSVALGTCMLYRFTARREAFPDACADNTVGSSPTRASYDHRLFSRMHDALRGRV